MKLKLRFKEEDAYDHYVPMSTQAMDVINALKKVTGSFEFAFPNLRKPQNPMSENTMGYLLNRAGYHSRHVPHGFRSSFSSIMNETFPRDENIIELILAHKPKDKVKAAYDRALHLRRRRELMQVYADLIIKGAAKASRRTLQGQSTVLNTQK